jgi:hypothetical protein
VLREDGGVVLGGGNLYAVPNKVSQKVVVKPQLNSGCRWWIRWWTFIRMSQPRRMFQWWLAWCAMQYPT